MSPCDGVAECRVTRSGMTRVTLSFVCAAAMTGCGDATSPAPTGDPSGAYAYLARIGLTPVVEGRVTFVVAGDSTITGTWELQRVPLSDSGIAVGPQVGSGTVGGRRTATGLWVDLNPGWADNNVFLALVPQSREALTGW